MCEFSIMLRWLLSTPAHFSTTMGNPSTISYTFMGTSATAANSLQNSTASAVRRCYLNIDGYGIYMAIILLVTKNKKEIADVSIILKQRIRQLKCCNGVDISI